VTAIANRVLTPRQQRREGKPELPPPATETAKNARIRLDRRDVWWNARSLMEYWRARLDWHSTLQHAQSHGVADANSFPSADEESRYALVEMWRTANVKLILTPAPDAGAVAWKKAALASGEHEYTDVKTERIERAIADDVEFLRTHPTRRRPPQGGDAA
jgi:hypothetical protein